MGLVGWARSPTDQGRCSHCFLPRLSIGLGVKLENVTYRSYCRHCIASLGRIRDVADSEDLVVGVAVEEAAAVVGSASHLAAEEVGGCQRGCLD
jgi:hypothetical protein